MPYKCDHCEKETTVTVISSIKGVSKPITSEARRAILKSDYEVVQVPTEVTVCDYCGFHGEFEEVEATPEPEVEEETFDRAKHYKNWMSWVNNLKKIFGENDEGSKGT